MTLLARHMAKLEAAEDLERAVYRAGLAWYEPARKAAEAKGRMVQAAQKLAAAESAIRSILQGFEGIDREFGADLWRLYNSGQLTRENIGEGGGRRIKDLLTAESGLGKAREEATRTQQRSSDANAKANGLYGDVIRALDALSKRVTPEIYSGCSTRVAVRIPIRSPIPARPGLKCWAKKRDNYRGADAGVSLLSPARGRSLGSFGGCAVFEDGRRGPIFS